ncbi:MAG: PAS domain S-box protein [Polyangiaceae bacterium]
MLTLLVDLREGTATLTKRMLAERHQATVEAPDIAGAIALLGTESVHSIVLGASSGPVRAEHCRALRETGAGRHAVILVVLGDEGAARLPELFDAGADDFYIESSGERVLRQRLVLMGRSSSAALAWREATEDRDQFLEISLDLLAIAGLDGYFKRLNPAWTATLGWPAAELLAVPWLDFVHPEDKASTVAAGSTLGQGTSVVGFTNRFRCKDGAYRWIEWRCAPSVERKLVYAAAHDITNRRLAEIALRELTENLAMTLNSIGDGVITTDAGGLIVGMNPAAERLAGWREDEARGQASVTVFDIVDDDTRAGLPSPVERALRGGPDVGLGTRTVLLRRDGTSVPVADSCSPIRDAGGVISGAVLVFRDAKSEREASRIREAAQKQLIISERMVSIGTLAAGVAHEINNPLSYIMANLDMVIEEVRALAGESTSERMRNLEDMAVEAREGADRVRKIVRGLKTFSRVEEDRRSVLELRPILEMSINMAFNEIRHQARLLKDYGATPLVVVDDARLGQVFINLLVNAAQAFPAGDTSNNQIRVATRTGDDGNAVVEVSDNGPGISPEVLARLFDPFFTTKPLGVGTGLGLSICHNLLSAMGGTITVHSELGQGATFRVSLPPAPGGVTALPPQELSEAGSAAPGHRAAVLVVDDEPAIGQAVSRVLRDHLVHVVTSVDAALDIIRGGKVFDVILCDLMIPGLTGIDFYHELSRIRPTLVERVVFITGGAFTSDANAFLDQIPNERFGKPFNVADLRALVERAARVHRAADGESPTAG